MLVILSGVSGAGKNTIKEALIERMERVVSLPSYTSREKRNGDIEGKDYIFVTGKEFEKMIENNELYKYDIHDNQYYGTSRKLLDEKIKEGKEVTHPKY